jgi:hypothetical protein
LRMEEFSNYIYDSLNPSPISNDISGNWRFIDEKSSYWRFHNNNIRGNRVSRILLRDLEIERRELEGREMIIGINKDMKNLINS